MNKITAKSIAKEVIKEAQNQVGNAKPMEAGKIADNSWEKATTEEKLERTRSYVKDMMRELSSLRRQVYKFNRHSHDEKGEPIVTERLVNGLGYGDGEVSEQTPRGGSYF